MDRAIWGVYRDILKRSMTVWREDGLIYYFVPEYGQAVDITGWAYTTHDYNWPLQYAIGRQ